CISATPRVPRRREENRRVHPDADYPPYPSSRHSRQERKPPQPREIPEGRRGPDSAGGIGGGRRGSARRSKRIRRAPRGEAIEQIARRVGEEEQRSVLRAHEALRDGVLEH